MDINDVMDDLAARLRGVPGLRVYDSPADQAAVPAAIVALPDSLNFDAAYSRGLDRTEVPIVLVVSKAMDRAARLHIGSYCAATGAKSVKRVLETGTYTSFDTLRLAGWDFGPILLGTTEYMGAVGIAEITGQGGS